MNAHIPKAYNELLDRIFRPEDRLKLETVVGSMLSGGEPQHVVIFGTSGSGKTSVSKIIRKLALFNMVENGRRTHHVVFQHEGYYPVESDSFVFAETKEPVAPKGAVFVETTGERLPVNKYYVLMQQIDSELDEIAEHCIQTYQHNLENNR
ncbi:hypothetical protein [Streptomyces phage Psst1]|nr:hypothetical protein [Streptomyces phage Psst1]WPJ30665.1 terminase small subunit [Streptomyces phage Psst2]